MIAMASVPAQETSVSRRKSVWRLVWAGFGAFTLALAALLDVSIIEPRVHVRWHEGLPAADRQALEQRYQLASGRPIDATTWRYDLLDTSPENVGALIGDPATADTAYIDRGTRTAPDREVRVVLRSPLTLVGPNPAGLVQVQSVLLFAAAGLLLWAAGLPEAARRRSIALASLAAVGIAAYAVPLGQPMRMGDSVTYTHTRESFELFSGVREIRFEAHLSHAILGRLDRAFGGTQTSPARAMDTLMRVATACFLASAVVLSIVERWSPAVLRYLALALVAPVSLLYFGYRELGHLSLNLATFPLLVRGLRQGSASLEASGILAGLGAALHGFGLLSVVASAVAALASRAALVARARLTLRLVAVSAAAYLGWVAIYLIVLKLPVVPGHAESIPFRPWFVAEVGDRVNAAILSRTGLRDIVMSAWIAGVPLLAVVATLWQRHRHDAMTAILYSLPSLIFLVSFWPIQGLAVEMDLVFAAFPALYAFAWVCAQEARSAAIAAALLASAHLAFWRVVLDSAFVNSRIG